MPDTRYKYVQSVWKAGDLTSLKDIFYIVPRSNVAIDLGLHYDRFSKKVNKPEMLQFRDIVSLAKLIDIEPKALADLVLMDIEANKTQPKKTRNVKRPKVQGGSQTD
jgi:hypothetical protein